MTVADGHREIFWFSVIPSHALQMNLAEIQGQGLSGETEGPSAPSVWPGCPQLSIKIHSNALGGCLLVINCANKAEVSALPGSEIKGSRKTVRVIVSVCTCVCVYVTPGPVLGPLPYCLDCVDLPVSERLLIFISHLVSTQ